MNPIIFEMGPLVLRWYGLMYAIAALVGGWLLGREVRRVGISLTDDQRWNFVLFGLLGGILGARIYYVVFNWDFYGQYPSEIPAIWHGGLAIHGGLVGAILTAYWYTRRHSLSFWQMADLSVPMILLGQAFGRWGNFMNGDAHGTPTDSFLGVVFPLTSIAGREFGAVPLHPVMLYELVLNLCGFFVLWSIRKRPWGAGFMFSLYLIFYSVIRFFVSFFRADDLYIGSLRAPHVVSVLLIVVMSAFIFKKRLWVQKLES